jgi:hypothetical protein
MEESQNKKSLASNTPAAATLNSSSGGLRFDPVNLKLNKRHTKIIATLNKKTSNHTLREFVITGMDGIRVFCDDGYDTCKRLIETVRLAAQETSRRVVVSIQLRCIKYGSLIDSF